MIIRCCRYPLKRCFQRESRFGDEICCVAYLSAMFNSLGGKIGSRCQLCACHRVLEDVGVYWIDGTFSNGLWLLWGLTGGVIAMQGQRE